MATFRRRIAQLLLGCAVVVFGFGGISAAARQDSSHRRRGRAADRPWLLEGEFRQDRALHATRRQIVVLELEPSSAGDASPLRRNTVSYRLEAGTVGFCLSADEPHLVALELLKPSGERVLRRERGGDCARVEIPAGRYRLHVDHDGTTVGSGAVAFVHDPVKPRLVGGAVAPVPDFMAFTGPDAQSFLSDAGPVPSRVGATATTVGPNEVWKLSGTSTPNAYTFTDGNGNLMGDSLECELRGGVARECGVRCRAAFRNEVRAWAS